MKNMLPFTLTLAVALIATTPSIVLAEDVAASASSPRLFISAAEIADRVNGAAAKTREQYPGAAHSPEEAKTREDFEYTYLQEHYGPALQSGPFRAELDYHETPRVGNGFRIHENAGELLFIIEGGGELSVGGTLMEPKLVGPGQFQAPAASGSVPHRMAKGDIILVPAKTAHAQTQVENAKTVVMMLPLPMPGGSASTRPASAGESIAGDTPRMFVTAAEIDERIAAAIAAAGAQYPQSTPANASAREQLVNRQLHRQPLLRAGPFQAVLDYHAVPDMATRTNKDSAQLLMLVDGAGTIQVGTTAHNMVKGDVVLVPPNTPHRLSQIHERAVFVSLPLPPT